LGVGLALVALVLAMVGALWYVLLKRKLEDTAAYSVEADVAAPSIATTESLQTEFSTLTQEAFTQVWPEPAGFDETAFPTF
jgi:hypothetical protein